MVYHCSSDMVKEEPPCPGEELDKLLQTLEEFLITARDLAPENVPENGELDGVIEELQLMIDSAIDNDIERVKDMADVADDHSLRRLDERITEMRATELTREMQKVIEETSGQ